jgi:hypothetical protein
VLEKLQQRRIPPVKVLEEHNERPLRGDRLEVATPGGERLLAAGPGGVCRDPNEGGEASADPVALGRVGNDRLDAGPKLLRRGVGVVGFEDASLRLDDLPERPEGDAFAVG